MDNKNRIMKAPDKLYVSQLIYETWQYQTPDPDDETQVEYIRKDLLLEWAKAEIELSKRVECVSEKSYEEGRQRVAQNLIDKLNSM